MELYFSPLACSMATRICLYEAGVDAKYTEVDPRTKRTPDGSDFRAIHPLGLVPTLRSDDGELLTENAAILQYVAESFPDARLAPLEPRGRARLRKWLSFVGTELHKALFVPLLDPRAPEGAKAYALGKADSRLSYLATHLEGRAFLLDAFSLADAYLFTVLSWTPAVPLDLGRWPALGGYLARLRERPALARAFAEERTLYAAELARNK